MGYYPVYISEINKNIYGISSPAPAWGTYCWTPIMVTSSHLPRHSSAVRRSAPAKAQHAHFARLTVDTHPEKMTRRLMPEKLLPVAAHCRPAAPPAERMTGKLAAQLMEAALLSDDLLNK